MEPTLFLLALTPLPFDVAGILGGADRYPFGRFILWIGAGKVINTVLTASLVSSYTIERLSGVLG
jgi:uncharacterized membrane protein YdjX (TVP38/TMEM64 family)